MSLSREIGVFRVKATVGALLVWPGLAGVTAPAFAQQQPIAPTLNASGASGLSVTPTALLLPWGALGLAYDNQVVSGPVDREHGTRGHNLVAGFGLLPNLEISGRIAANTLNTNCYTENCGIRDLSFNFKAGTPLDRDNRWHIAAGATDLGGQTGNFRSVYGVLTYRPVDPIDLSAGLARRGGAATVTTPLDGVFASAAYRPFSWLQTHVEYADSKAWAGARVYAPATWLPAGWQAHVGANVRVHGSDRVTFAGGATQQSARGWVGVGLNIPLFKVPTTVSAAPRPRLAQDDGMPEPPPRRVYSASGLPASATPLVADLAPPVVVAKAPPSARVNLAPPSEGPSPEARAAADAMARTAAALPSVAPVDDAQLVALGEALRDKGFEDIAIGRAGDGAVAVRLNNATYNANTADGLGVALGVLARRLADQRAGYRLVLTQRQLAIVGVTGQADCLAQWIAQGPPRCTAGQLYTPGTTGLEALLADTRWVVDGRAPSWATPRVILQPVLRTGVATEYGVLDHSLALRAMLQQPLWRGAWAEVAGNTPLHESNDYKAGQVFGNSRFVSQTDRYMVHQMFRVPVESMLGQLVRLTSGRESVDPEKARQTAERWGAAALTAHVATGRIDANYRGHYGELRWEPGEGRHKFGVEAGRFQRVTYYDPNLPINSRTALANYRYAFTPTRTYFEAAAGQFLYNDRGVRLGIKQWFDDVAVTVYVRHSKFEYAAQGRTSAGIEVSLPLTPRKDMSPTAPVQVVGNPRWSYGIETVVREDANVLNTTQGVGSNVSMLDRTFNFDRAGLAYFEDNMPRIRSAAGR
ncbi:YjbH domain-containing protein [Comamonadaceae bacterium OTU4NAUVB1]|nr:YjbH domain-containing protein [Comamonadaceae bacterium OTU4NAUVB1]